ncbi:MAG: calcium/sodium antiporter [Firmicutes bacterium]|nr:calcium/sodium antiporter [Bacillota bacterium]
MERLLVYVWLLVGFVCLIKGADFFVDGSSSVAKTFKVPSVIIGLTIVAMGTSLPETAVSASAALRGANAIAVSNVIGSNIFNLMVVVGICAAIKPVGVNKELMKRDFPFSLAATVFMLIVIVDAQLFKATSNMISRVNGITFLVMFVIYMFVLIKSTLEARKNAPDTVHDEEYKVLPLWLSIIYIVGGIIGIKVGGDLVVDSASEIAARFGLSQTLIGLTIVACGTSLPELVTSIVASQKGENDLALGNVVGSNIFNILFVLGISSTICPIKVETKAVTDICVLLLFNVYIYILTRTTHKVNRPGGISMVILYVLYTAYIIYRDLGAQM